MSFSQIKGQDRSILLLKEYIKMGHLGSAYLFMGPDGVGKYMAARTLAKSLNCIEEGFDSCDKCPSCLKIDKNQHPDFHLISNFDSEDAVKSESVKIDQIRHLQRQISLKPYEARKKVFIIDNAHNLTPGASNALLKILEEPPANSLIILISSKPNLLFKTIISRCQILKFSSLPRLSLEEILKRNYHLDAYSAHFLAYFSEGRLGYALTLKDTDIFREKNAVIDGFISSGNAGTKDLMPKDKDTLRLYLNILASWLRDVYLIKAGFKKSELINSDRKDQLLKIMNRYTFSDLDESLNYVSNSLLYLEQNVNTKLLLSCLKAFMKG